MNRLFESLSKEQRLDMVMKGLSPANPDHIKTYLHGGRLDKREQLERIDMLVGGINNSVGSGNEKEMRPPSGQSFDPDRFEAQINKQQTDPTEIRKRLTEEMRNPNNQSADKVFTSDDILSFATKKQPQQKQNVNVLQEGYGNARNYVNAFVVNLREGNAQSSYKMRLELFKALKICLKEEAKYEHDPAKLQQYRAGVLQAEKKLLESITANNNE